MRLRNILIAATAIAALGAAACGKTETADTMATNTPMAEVTSSPTPSMENQMADAQNFVNMAGQAGLVEIETSKLALTKTKQAGTKTFAQMMIDDHTKTADKLKALASANGLAAPAAALDDNHMRRMNDLNETDGDEDFDQDYAALQVDAHNDTIKLFEDYAGKTDAHPALKAFADETLPALRTHLAAAEKLRDGATKNPS